MGVSQDGEEEVMCEYGPVVCECVEKDKWPRVGMNMDGDYLQVGNRRLWMGERVRAFVRRACARFIDERQ